ncbi:unnamed protein product [Musa acuminata subsp. malaccensis]|uniref:(wild Malaysian banana) hypothetical protein n=1 Tax=Musa acuminata subsp. malaccensis TaxID=214687 RepID=A0A804IWQ6_MUSAM|nr:unnamed protein product [Musa acuminata subsp. malaccensis]
MGSSSAESYDYAFKIVLTRDSSVGKTSFTSHFVGGQRPSLGVLTSSSLAFSIFLIRNTKLKLTIWDTDQFELYRTVTKDYYRCAHGIIMGYPISLLCFHSWFPRSSFIPLN